MSVLIKGVEMPTSCGDCKAFVCYRQWAGDVGDCFCGITKNDAKAKEKNADCPLIPIPPHGDLIDLSAKVNAQYYDDADEEWSIKTVTVKDILYGVCEEMPPTIIPASEEGE